MGTLGKLFVTLGLLVIVVLFTALIGPHFVDWNAWRGTFEAQASSLVGRPVAIRGKADLRLLPLPVVWFSDVRIGDETHPELTIEEFRAEIELTSLLRGDMRVASMRVERPRLNLDLAGASGAPGLDARRGGAIPAERVSLGRVEIVDGSAEIGGFPRGRTWHVDGLGGALEADSLAGPYKLQADFRLDGDPLSVNAALGRISAGTMTAKAQIQSPLYPAILATDGEMSVSDGAVGYSGDFTLAERPVPEAATPTLWTDFRAAGSFDLSPDALTVEEGQLSWGVLERPLVVQASGRVDFGPPAPRYEASLKARQIDIDYALGRDPENPAPIADVARSLLGMLSRIPQSPIAGLLHIEAQGIVIAGSVVEGVGADLISAPGGWGIRGLEATLPGSARIAVDGDLGLEGGPSFIGRSVLTSANPAPLIAWLSGAAGGAGRAAAIDRLAFASDLQLTREATVLSDIVAELGGGSVAGDIEFHRFVERGETVGSVDVQAGALDIAALGPLLHLLRGPAETAGRADNVTLSINAEAITAGGVAARSVTLDGTLRRGVPDLSLSVDDLAGARLTARIDFPDKPAGATRDPPDLLAALFDGGAAGPASVDVTLEAADLSGAAAFLSRLAPDNDVVAKFQDIAPRLSPVVGASIHGEFAEGAGSLTVDGDFADAGLYLTAQFDRMPRDLRSLSGSGTLNLDAPDIARLFSLAGLATPPEGTGPVSVKGEFSGGLANGGSLSIEGAAAGVTFGYDATFASRDEGIAFEGGLAAGADDLEAPLRLAGFPSPELGEGHSASIDGTLAIGENGFSLTPRDAALDGHPLKGIVNGEFRDGVRLSGSLGLQALSLPSLAGIAIGAPAARAGNGWSDAAFSARLPRGVTGDFTVSAATLDLGLPMAAAASRLRLQFGEENFSFQVEEAEFAGGQLSGSLTGKIEAGAVNTDLRVTLAGAALAPLVWQNAEGSAASGRLDASLDVTASGRSMAGLVAGLSGSGAFMISEGSIAGLNPLALSETAKIADSEAEPDDSLILETFYSSIGAGALAFDRAAGAFAVADGIVDVPTVTAETPEVNVMVTAKADLNALTLSSEWTIRAKDALAEGEPAPTIDVVFRGAFADPDREFDLRPLIELVNVRYRLRQLRRIEDLEEARRRAEVERLAEPPAAGNVSGPAGAGDASLPVRRPDEPAGEDGVGEPLDLIPQSPPADAADAADAPADSPIRRLAPAFEGLDINR